MIRGEVYNDAGQLLVISHKITAYPNRGLPKDAATYEERDGIAAQACKCCWCEKEYKMGDLVHGAAKSKRQSKRFCPGPVGWKDCASAYFNAHYIAKQQQQQRKRHKNFLSTTQSCSCQELLLPRGMETAAGALRRTGHRLSRTYAKR